MRAIKAVQKTVSWAAVHSLPADTGGNLRLVTDAVGVVRVSTRRQAAMEPRLRRKPPCTESARQAARCQVVAGNFGAAPR